LGQLSEEHLVELKAVFSHAYHNGHMYEDFLKDLTENPEVFQTFLARQDDRLIGVMVIESKPHSFINYHQFPPIHLKRFTVLPQFRRRGVGKGLLDDAKGYAFDESGIKVIFGESNEAGALSFYGREDALFSVDVIKNYSKRNTPEENLSFFREFISNPKFAAYRFPEGDGIQFVFCKSEDETKFFRQHGFVSKQELISDLKFV